MVPTKFGIKCLLRFVQSLLVFGALANAQFNIQNSGLNERGCGHVGQTTPKVCTVSQAMQSNGVNFNGLVVAFAARPQSNGVNFKVHNVKFGDDYMEKASGLDYDGMFPTDTTPKTNGWMSVYYIGGNHLEGVTRDISYTLTPDANKEIGKVVWSRILVRGAKGIVPLKLFQGGGVPGTQSKTITNTLYDTYGKSVNAQWFGFMFFRKEAQADCGTCFNVPGGSKNTEIKAKSNLGFGTSKVTSGETDGEVTFTWEHTFDNSPYGHAVFAVYRDKSPCENPNFSCGANGACKNTFYNDCLCKNGYKGPFCQYGPQQMYIHDNAFRKRRYIESPDANTNAIQIKHSMPPRKYSYPCTFLEDIELLGENFVGGFLNIVNTTGECCQLCQSYKDCKAWKFDKSDASVATRGQCWLQKTVGASGTLSSKNCVLSDWSPWGDCAILREEDYSCGEEVCGENANGVRRCGRLSCTGEDVSLLDEGTVSLNKEKFVLRFQSRSRALLEKPENGGTGCINGVLNEARPCCTSTEKGYVAQISAFEGAVKTCNGTDWV